MAKMCDRCGEKFYLELDERVFAVQYETKGLIGGHHIWRHLDLCPDCQQDLRNEFYRRDLIYHGDED